MPELNSGDPYPPWTVVVDRQGLAWQNVGGPRVGGEPGEYHYENSVYKGGMGYEILEQKRGPLRVVWTPRETNLTPDRLPG
jgi:hypothetical protein